MYTMSNVRQKSVAKNVASLFFETNLIDKFKSCFDDQLDQDSTLQEAILEFTNEDTDFNQRNECLLKQLVKAKIDNQLSQTKQDLFAMFSQAIAATERSG